MDNRKVGIILLNFNGSEYLKYTLDSLLKAKTEVAYEAGVIGTDRVAIEGLAMGYPVLEMGYGRVIGIIDEEMMGVLRDTNFDANLMTQISGVTEKNV